MPIKYRQSVGQSFVFLLQLLQPFERDQDVILLKLYRPTQCWKDSEFGIFASCLEFNNMISNFLEKLWVWFFWSWIGPYNVGKSLRLEWFQAVKLSNVISNFLEKLWVWFFCSRICSYNVGKSMCGLNDCKLSSLTTWSPTFLNSFGCDSFTVA